jgi:hypothetical protein
MKDRAFSDAATAVLSSRQVWTATDGEAVILNTEHGVYYGLDEVGARVWELLREPRRIAELRDQLLAEYAVESAKCDADLQALLSELVDAGLVEVNDAAAE